MLGKNLVQIYYGIICGTGQILTRFFRGVLVKILPRGTCQDSCKNPPWSTLQDSSEVLDKNLAGSYKIFSRYLARLLQESTMEYAQWNCKFLQDSSKLFGKNPGKNPL